MIIKRKVTLEFLGDEYKESYLVFKSVSVGEVDKIDTEAKKIADKKDASAVTFILDILKDKFLEGQVLGEVVKAEDLDQLDIETTLRAFRRLTGQEASESFLAP